MRSETLPFSVDFLAALSLLVALTFVDPLVFSLCHTMLRRWTGSWLGILHCCASFSRSRLISRFLSSLQCSILSCPRPFLFVLIHRVLLHFVLRQDSFHTVLYLLFPLYTNQLLTPFLLSLHAIK